MLAMAVLTAGACQPKDDAGLVLVSLTVPGAQPQATALEITLGKIARRFVVMGLGTQPLVRGIYVTEGHGTKVSVSVVASAAGSCPRWRGEGEVTLPPPGGRLPRSL